MHKKYSRRKMIVTSMRTAMYPLILLPVAAYAKSKNSITPAQTEGPFYPVVDQQDKDVDLTSIKGRSDVAQGDIIKVSGNVYDDSGDILQGAFVEIWQANKFGRYRHARDPSNAPLDPGFQGWGQTRTSESGRYGFKTILPGAYPAGRGWIRPPHIHFKVKADGCKELTTQMYFPGQELNNNDLILQNLSTQEQALVVSRKAESRKAASSSSPESEYIFDIYLKKFRR